MKYYWLWQLHRNRCTCWSVEVLHSKRSSLFDTFVPIRIVIEIDIVCLCVHVCVCVFVCLIYWPLIDFPPPNWTISHVSYFSCLGKRLEVSSPSAGTLPVWMSTIPVLIHVCVSLRQRWTLCIRVCLALHHHLLISSLHPPPPSPPHHAGFKVINFFIRICQQSVLLWGDNGIRLFSWVHA